MRYEDYLFIKGDDYFCLWLGLEDDDWYWLVKKDVLVLLFLRAGFEFELFMDLLTVGFELNFLAVDWER